MHVGDLAGREAQVAEDDVLDPLGEEGLATCPGFLGLLLQEMEDHREVMNAE
jgi:hypothetical protein